MLTWLWKKLDRKKDLRSFYARVTARFPVCTAWMADRFLRCFENGWNRLEAVLFNLPEKKWPGLVRAALTRLQQDREDRNAATLLNQAVLQCPVALHPHLEQVFTLLRSRSDRHLLYGWREAGADPVRFLTRILGDDAQASEARLLALACLLETRRPEALEFACRHDGLLEKEWFAEQLAAVGYERTAEGWVRRLYHDVSFILCQAPGASAGLSSHPTWRLAGPASPRLRFGGPGLGMCNLCDRRLQHLLTLHPVPAGIGVSGFGRLTLEACLSCLYWEEKRLFYLHDPSGRPTARVPSPKSCVPKFKAQPLREETLCLVQTPKRWFWSNWSMSNGWVNINRVGGHPYWAQSAEYPACPHCKQTMHFLAQIDSGWPNEEGDVWRWGSGGWGYCFWCDSCRISGFLLQCT